MDQKTPGTNAIGGGGPRRDQSQPVLLQAPTTACTVPVESEA
jgi:hypothetical protein